MMILASQSPRRRELMRLICPDFAVVPAQGEEYYPPDCPPKEIPAYLAKQKAQQVAADYPKDTVIGADTIVLCNDAVLGKPKDEKDAQHMLQMLSGNTHHVITGVCICTPQKTVSFTETTAVTFRNLTASEILQYIKSGEPMDKAGAYGIQEQGAVFVSKIEGDFYTVMGLPVCRLYTILHERQDGEGVHIICDRDA